MSTTVLHRRDETPETPPPRGRAPPTPVPIRIFAIDEHPLCRRGMAAMLSGDGSCEWLGEAGGSEEALHMACAVRPDVALIDHRPPAIDGIALVVSLQALWPAARFIVLTSRLDAADVKRAMNAGASCVLDKTVTASDLVLAVRAVHSGQRVVLPAIASALDDSQRVAMGRNELTPRELTLLQLMAQGLDNRAISVAMHITIPTVKFHVTNVMSKLHAANRTAAVLTALRMRIITLEPAVSA